MIKEQLCMVKFKEVDVAYFNSTVLTSGKLAHVKTECVKGKTLSHSDHDGIMQV